MLGHSFLHDGPCVTGLSSAIIHVLFNGDPEMATIVTEDCPDLHIRSIIEMLETEELTQEQQDTVSDLSMSWDLPAVTKTNRRWLQNKLLVHAMLLDKIIWPVEDNDDDDEFDVETTCRITGFLRLFIETASPRKLAELLKFWVGWEVLPCELKVELSRGSFPTSTTCFETLKLPVHFKSYTDFEAAFMASINSTHTGFGLV
ncbi:uncharacterized protein LOC143510082 isoform X2 [Brachyhypopomus gauderio]|uniref:uncharacterized protein LOC143510082 isoform X2 n=1 Tax=Brachyhypopomus gauderio TaxID=698409 RepID=UPI004042B627